MGKPWCGVSYCGGALWAVHEDRRGIAQFTLNGSILVSAIFSENLPN